MSVTAHCDTVNGSWEHALQCHSCTWEMLSDLRVWTTADQSDLAATPDSGRGSFISDEAVVVCQQEVPDKDISDYARSHQAQVFATSAKTGTGVRRLFSAIAEDLAKNRTQDTHTQVHRHAAQPATPISMNSRLGTNPSSPLESSNRSTYTRTHRKYFQNCCC